MAYEVTAKQLVRFEIDQKDAGPHVVILGSGASRAAFPSGDQNGRKLPVMGDFVATLGLEQLVREADGDPTENFESFYSRLAQDESRSHLRNHLENRVRDYFSALKLPDHVTLYDLLLMTLRPKDVIATFNWDPFLVDAYRRSSDSRCLPRLMFLHGNVRVGVCERCSNAFSIEDPCPTCGERGVPTPLLFPVEKKNYSRDPFIDAQWSTVRGILGSADRLTLFGYGAPATDADAKQLLCDAWLDEGRLTERIELIDIEARHELQKKWEAFSIYHRFDTPQSFFRSSLAQFPRRSCEALACQGVSGLFTEPIEWFGSTSRTGCVEEAWTTVAELIDAEIRSGKH